MAALDLQPVPSYSTNGSALPGYSPTYSGVEFILNTGDALAFTMSNFAPTSPPYSTSITYADTTYWTELMANGLQPYITSVTGSPSYRWIV